MFTVWLSLDALILRKSGNEQRKDQKKKVGAAPQIRTGEPGRKSDHVYSIPRFTHYISFCVFPEIIVSHKTHVQITMRLNLS